MSQTGTKVIQQCKTQPFGFFDLKTVQWIGSVRAVNQVTKFTKEKTKTDQFPIMGWIVGTIEMFIIHIYLFIHSLPWPDWMMNIIKRIDHLIEHFLEYVHNKLDWWWDVLMVRLIRLRDSIEALIDAFLSVCLFVVYKVIEFWMKVFNLSVEFMKIIFAPVIWIFKAIFPPPEAEKKNTSAPKPVNDSYPTSSQNGSNKSNNDGSAKVNELEEQNRFSPTTSDCDSDVSAVSESWSIGHTDKHGKYYNRIEMKATAEGKLRAYMFKRVKAQLTLMRRNSVSISKGMTSYALDHLLPRIKPKANALIQRIKAIAAKYGLDELYEQLLKEKENHYLLSLIWSSVIYVTLIPVKFLNKTLLHEKKKSRRTRSMRSESLRRRTGNIAGVVPQTGSPYGLNLSKEPVVNEESEEMGNFLPKKEEPEGMILEEKEEGNKLEDDHMRDSALASSVDDIYLLSDSNDGGNSLKDQTIHEEEPEEHLTPMENGKITSSEENLRSSNRSEHSSSKEDIDMNKESKSDQEPPRTKKSVKQRKPPPQPQLHQQKQQPHPQRPKQKQQQQQHQQKQQQQQEQQQQEHDNTSEPCIKPVSSHNGDTEASPQTRKKSIILNKDGENTSEDQRKENNGKSPKRKISFSLT